MTNARVRARDSGVRLGDAQYVRLRLAATLRAARTAAEHHDVQTAQRVSCRGYEWLGAVGDLHEVGLSNWLIPPARL